MPSDVHRARGQKRNTDQNLYINFGQYGSLIRLSPIGENRRFSEVT